MSFLWPSERDELSSSEEAILADAEALVWAGEAEWVDDGGDDCIEIDPREETRC